MSVLSDSQILEAYNDKKIVIDPFNKANLSTSSYDIRLGEFFFREHRPNLTGGESDIFNPYNRADVNRVWGTEAYQSVVAEEVFRNYPFDYVGIDREDHIILLNPHETILGHSQEFIGGVSYHTSMMKARSSFGRCFIEVCKCAGWGDIGYFNRWTMEITNNSHYYAIPLVVGRRLAQIAFLSTGITLAENDYTTQGSYQQSKSLEEVKASWHPTMMLPQLWRDRDINTSSSEPVQTNHETRTPK